MSNHSLYLATGNQGKLRELAALAAAAGFLLEALPDYKNLPPAQEDASSFALNALEKGLHYSRFTNALVVADDSGLAVDALGGGPGPRSARFAGPRASDADNNHALLAALADVPDERRTARYVCVLTLAQQNRLLALFSDTCEGHILGAPRGTGGFGYDPLFFFPPLGRTMAELSLAEKNQHSHRARAFRKLLGFLTEQ
jgi:XTP/dITP diphosphohydrolase